MSNTDGHQDAPIDHLLLNALRKGSEVEKRAALDQIYSALIQDASRLLGKQKGRADLQVESIVQSALVAELERGAIDRCNDDSHLKRRLRLAVKNKMLDRKKKRKPQAFPKQDSDLPFDAPTLGEGPATQVVRAEEERENSEALARLRDACKLIPLDVTDRRILALYLFENKGWAEIAEAVGSTEGATKKKMTVKIRPIALGHLLGVVREQVSGSTWNRIDRAILRNTKVQAEPSYVCTDNRSLAEIWKHDVDPLLRTQYGDDGAALIVMLVGRVNWQQ